jgi:hypothetical protein
VSLVPSNTFEMFEVRVHTGDSKHFVERKLNTCERCNDDRKSDAINIT